MSSGDVRAEIRRRYAAAARVVLGGLGPTWSSTPSPDPLSLFLEEGPTFGSCHYSAAELATIPAAAVRASLGCGSPTTGAPLAAGQIVLDIGCGGGIDSILAAKMVEPDGLVIGLDISAEMVELARRNAAAALTRNAFFVTGLMEELPIANQLTDVVIGNSAINLSTAKERTLSELFRVLAPGGRLHIVDLVADDSLSPADRMARVVDTNATAGLFSVSEYDNALRNANFSEVSIAPHHEVADRVMAAQVTAIRA